MYEKFSRLKEDKRDRILNAALAEFGDRGYKNASTNNIVEAAGIAKGLLFHYFPTKKDLFIYLYDFCLMTLNDNLIGKAGELDNDLFARWIHITAIKKELTERYPDIFRFMTTASKEENKAVKGYTQNARLYLLATNKLYAQVDKSKFRDGLDAGRCLDIIFWTLKGLEERNSAPEDMKIYLDILRDLMYKESADEHN
ncbi:MAG: TetR/AcrR family transcriptional regulator [Bacillota bacterium]|nr:TetR/AcrR family transcriptional regulator [Bacillota bacterium]